jgi:hypothetical protein
MLDKIPQRSPSQPREGGRGRHLYNFDDSKKRSKSAPPDIVSGSTTLSGGGMIF